MEEKRNCGSCTLCCLVTRVPEFEKLENIWCSHCNINKDCNIYEQRPLSCKKFECEWYSNAKLDENLRPDKCGVVFEKFTDLTYFALVDPNRALAWQDKCIMDFINQLLFTGHAVAITSGINSEKHIIVPIGYTPEDIWTDIITTAKRKGLITN